MAPPKKLLEDVPPEKVFRFENGAAARNIYELLDRMEDMDAAQFGRYCNPGKDDFSKWIQEVIGDHKLSTSLLKIKDKTEYAKQIGQRIRTLERGALIPCIWNRDFFKFDEEGNKNIYVFGLIGLTLVISLILLILLYARLDQKINTFDQRIQELQERNLLFYQLQIEYMTQLQNLTRTSNLESPSSLEEFFYQGEISAPSNKISEDQIHVYDDKVVISVKNVSWAKFLNTGSMLPTLGENANSLEIAPNSPKDIHEGDIIIYNTSDSHDLIIHRVVEMGIDEQGWYVMTKGDNNKLVDPSKVRFSQIQRILVGVIY